MNELRREFLKQTISNLETLRNEFPAEIPSDFFFRRYFQCLHTIKGTSRIFGLQVLSGLAHELENFLQSVQANQIPFNDEAKSTLQSGLNHLLDLAIQYSSDRGAIISPRHFVDGLPTPETSQKHPIDPQMAAELTAQLSESERNELGLAMAIGKNFYIVEAFFELASFADEFKRFRQILEGNGSAIAVAPAVPNNPATEIGFRIFFVGYSLKDVFAELIKDFRAEIVFEHSSDSTRSGIFGNIVADGERIARLLEKSVKFEVSVPDAEVPDWVVLLLNDVAVQLIRNAIDHGIETPDKRTQLGKNPIAGIAISLVVAENGLILRIEDDGRGIDAQKITQIARDKGFISENESLSKESALRFIFTHRFSTRETASEISGRGVGLDAVKSLIENSGGRIEVETEVGTGTAFIVYLPRDFF